ncbi:MAG: hypothetical protein GHCLOJNM_01639 [bacterium]|nr:hypothetical protein [bacterium]
MVGYARRTVPFLVGGAVLLLASWISLARQSADRLAKAEALEAEGKLVDAIEQYEWAIQAYTPGGGSVARAVEALERIGARAESLGEDDLARRAWQALVSGLIVIEHVTQPYSARLSAAEARLESVETRLLEESKAATAPSKP